MPDCESCGKPYEGSPRFCPSCGRPIAAAAAVEPVESAEPAEAAGPAAEAPAPPPPPQYAPQAASQGASSGAEPPRRSLKWLWIGLAALVVVVAIVLVLVLVVFNGGGGGSGATGPEKAVTQFFEAMEAKDIDGVFAVISPGLMEGLSASGMEVDAIKEMMAMTLFGYESITFNDLEMSIEMTSDTTATVTVTGGSVTLVDVSGAEETQDVAEAGEPVSIEVVKVDDTWYLVSSPFTQ